LLKNTLFITDEIVSLARSNGGRWTVNFSDFRESCVEIEANQELYIATKNSFWSKLIRI